MGDIELPEPDEFGEIDFDDGSILSPPMTQPIGDIDRKWMAVFPVGNAHEFGEDKKWYHTTAQGAAKYLRSLGYGPGAEND